MDISEPSRQTVNLLARAPALLLVLTLGLAGCDQPPSNADQGNSADGLAAQQQIDAFFTRFTDQWIETNPNAAVATAYFTGDKQDEMERRLTPYTREYRLSRIAMAKEGLAQLAQLDLSEATPTQRRSAQVMQWQLEMSVAFEPYLDYTGFPLQQFWGVNDGLVTNFSISHPFQNARDAENYVVRLREVDERMGEAIEGMRDLATKDIHPPRFILDATIEKMAAFVTAAPQDSPFVTTLGSKAVDLEDLEEERLDQLMVEAATIVENEIYPAWEAALEQLRSQLDQATDFAGLSRFPQGLDVYALNLKAYTTTDFTADQIHEIGLAEVARIEAEMHALFDQIGIPKGEVTERVAMLKEQLRYPDTDQGRDDLIQDLQAIIDDAVLRSQSLFDEVPRSPVIVQPYPEYMWETAAASYAVPPLDGSRPGIYQMPLRSDQLSRFGKRSLVYHETVPGHHFQLALVNENEDLHRFMRIGAYGGNAAIVEGWALYAEQLAAEAGWYEDDVEGLLGQLDFALFRARRLVVDTGLHTKGWTRQQAIDYGIPANEVDRYVVAPGQATSYMIGQLRIVSLREKARRALGDSFSINEFHNVVLGAGVVPLTMLEEMVDEYVAARLSRE